MKEYMLKEVEKQRTSKEERMDGWNAKLNKAAITVLKYLLHLFQGFMLELYKIDKHHTTRYVFI
jgi:hypothetical protein